MLFATTPFVGYVLSLSVAFAVSLRDLYRWQQVKDFAAAGAIGAAVLAAIAFLLGRRIQERLVATRTELIIERRGALRRTRELRLAHAELSAFAVEASLRSLGADTLLVAVHADGRRTVLLEGDPHSGQTAQLAGRLRALAGHSAG